MRMKEEKEMTVRNICVCPIMEMVLDMGYDDCSTRARCLVL
jgi:hypothetical protein